MADLQHNQGDVRIAARGLGYSIRPCDVMSLPLTDVTSLAIMDLDPKGLAKLYLQEKTWEQPGPSNAQEQTGRQRRGQRRAGAVRSMRQMRELPCKYFNRHVLHTIRSQ